MPEFKFWSSLNALMTRAGVTRRRPSAAVVICTERHFENKSLLLIETLRRFGGALGAGLPVFSYSPRPSKVPSERVRRQLAALDVELVLDVQNSRWPEYDFANKVVACADAERRLGAETIIFLDSDKIVLREPSALILPPGVDVAARPVDRKFIGRRVGERDEHQAYWCRLYEIAGALPQRDVRTTLDDEAIWEYYNSGLVAARRAAGIFSHWEAVFGQILASGVFPATGLHYVEQSALAAAITAKANRVEILTRDYNLPVIPEYADVLESRPELLANAATWHYHRSFDHGGWKKWLSGSGLQLPPEKLSWLTEKLTEYEI
jgi:hypothetical protein